MTDTSPSSASNSVRLILSFDADKLLFHAQSPEVQGWHAEASTPYTLHKQFLRQLRLGGKANIDIQYKPH
ncbi:hypothetical protein AAV94_13255 [Lampropedia cohaerens]|uniref:Uncharacterized protein n=1 Tax=Lampropedia cohaerens TaxID=1610491 RepID=A0A0U1PWU8_9BURK|nr:hypothetical protein [Lampropedia cohaerens]KKW67014.1 hypothetical protein AAV94_13255 [Lampropedia cohaerens]